MAWTANDIKNLALTELNHEMITNWNDRENTDIQLINTQYALAKKVALSRYAWSFATRHQVIELEEADGSTVITPNFKYKYVGELPDDALCNITAYANECETMLADYYVVGNTICAKQDKLFLQYTANVSEAQYTAEFVDWIKVFFASRLNGYMNGDMQRQQLLDTEEVVLFRTAKNIDSKRNKHESITGNPLLWIRGRR